MALVVEDTFLTSPCQDLIFKGKFDEVRSTFGIARKDVALALELAREYDVPIRTASDTYDEMTAGCEQKRMG